MRKRKQILKRPARARVAAKDGRPEHVARNVAAQEPIPSFETLLNKYNQKSRAGQRKSSPAADEEME